MNRGGRPISTATHCKHGHDLSIDDNVSIRRMKTGDSRKCRVCLRAATRRSYRKYAKTVPPMPVPPRGTQEWRRYRKNKKLRSVYGITLAQYEQMFAEQDGRCYLCGERHEILCVDHCHKSGAIRKLLCRLCNTGLGAFDDDTWILARAIEYIASFRGAS